MRRRRPMPSWKRKQVDDQRAADEIARRDKVGDLFGFGDMMTDEELNAFYDKERVEMTRLRIERAKKARRR